MASHHDEGGIAPFTFQTYADALAHRDAINAAVQFRTMSHVRLEMPEPYLPPPGRERRPPCPD